MFQSGYVAYDVAMVTQLDRDARPYVLSGEYAHGALLCPVSLNRNSHCFPQWLNLNGRKYRASRALSAAKRRYAGFCPLAACRSRIARSALGEWLTWLGDNCSELTIRTAQQYMAYAEGKVDSLHKPSHAKNTSEAHSPEPPAASRGPAWVGPPKSGGHNALPNDAQGVSREELEETAREFKAQQPERQPGQ